VREQKNENPRPNPPIRGRRDHLPPTDVGTALDEHYGVGEFRLKLFGWSVERRFVVIREEIREARASVGRKLIDVPGYTFAKST
jgi:hypothetical protein